MYATSKDPETVSMAYSEDSEWRNRSQFVKGREQIREFLRKKWESELEYKLQKWYWCHSDNRIAVRFAYEYRNQQGQWCVEQCSMCIVQFSWDYLFSVCV